MNRIKELSAGALLLVPESLADAENIYKYMGCDPEMIRYTGWNPYQSLEATIEKITNDMNAEDGSYSWTIKKDNEFIGTIAGYEYDPETGSIQLGYSIARPYWGNGYAGTAARAVLEFLMNEPHINSVEAWSHKDNIASKKVLLGCGLAEVGVDEDHVIYKLSK